MGVELNGQAGDRMMAEQGPVVKKLRRELERAAERLKELQEKEGQCLELDEEFRALRQAADNMQLGLTITDMEGKIIYVNPAEALMHGYTRGDLINKEGRILAPSRLWKQMSLADMCRIKSYGRDSVNCRKNGSLFTVRLLSDLVTDGRGEPIGVVTTCEDISERRRIEKELCAAHEDLERKVDERTATLAATNASLQEEIVERQRLEQEKDRVQAELVQVQKIEAVGQLSAGVAHDFNNILSAILGYSGLWMMKLKPEDPLYRDLSRIDAAAQRAAKLTRQLLLFSRKAPVDVVRLDLNHTIVEIMKMLPRLLGEDIAVKTVLEPDLRELCADEGNIEQVLLNLTVNARDAMPQGGALTISTTNVVLDREAVPGSSEPRSGEFLRLTVTDTGCGIEAEVLPHVFEPFFTTKGSTTGTGLGLSVVYGIISQHQGWIQVKSSPGAGATFTVFLPAATPETHALKVNGRVYPAQLGKGEKILLVEDDDDVRELAARVLRDNGYVVREAACSTDALDLFQQESVPFDLLVSDVVLPDLNGLKLAERLLALKGDLVVLLMSGYTDEKSQLSLIRQRGFGFIHKPFSIPALLGAISGLLSGSPPR